MDDNYHTLPTLLDFDRAFAETDDPIVINEYITHATSDDIVSRLCTDINNVSHVAKCDCGEEAGNAKIDQLCDNCNTRVKEVLLVDITNDTWLDVPEKIGRVLHPVVYSMLNKWLGKDSNGNLILRTLMDISLPVAPEYIDLCKGQGFKWFADNFSYIIDHFVHKVKRTSVKPIVPGILRLLMIYEERIWCTKLPLLSRGLHPVTMISDTVKLVDAEVSKIMRAVMEFSDALLMEEVISHTSMYMERKFASIYTEYIDYKNMLIKDKLNPHKGHLRRHIFGGRLNFTFRSVITPISDVHYGDELQIGWQLGVGVFKYHIMAIMIHRHKFTMNDAYRRVTNAIVSYDFLVDKIMQIIIAECKYKGFPCLFNRNPSLCTASIQLLFITKVRPCLQEDPYPPKYDKVINEEGTIINVEVQDIETDYKRSAITYDKTIAISTLVIDGFNADFDGDECNVVLLLESDDIESYMVLHPREHMISPTDISMGNLVVLQNQACVMLDMWASDS